MFSNSCEIAWHACFVFKICQDKSLTQTQLLASLVMSFKPFGSVKVEWPGKADGRHLHHPPKGKLFLSLLLKECDAKLIAKNTEF